VSAGAERLVVSGNPTEEELAALVVALFSRVSEGAPQAGRQPAAWSRDRRGASPTSFPNARRPRTWIGWRTERSTDRQEVSR
jgi:hypothetical protein